MSNIEIQQPQPFDIVGETILIAGNAVGFESHLSIYVSDGHFEVQANASAGSTSIRQFQASVTIPADIDFQLDRLHITVADDSAGGDGAPIPSVIVPVIYGPKVLPGYAGYWNHLVMAGDTLSGLANQYYGDSTAWQPIYRANQQVIADPDIIIVGQNLRIPRTF
jgi:nucleoid-associated protein YgaU